MKRRRNAHDVLPLEAYFLDVEAKHHPFGPEDEESDDPGGSILDDPGGPDVGDKDGQTTIRLGRKLK